VQEVETYQAGQPVKLSPVGGGGTDSPALFHLAERPRDSTADVGLPNGPLGHIPRSGATLPVLWASTDTRKAPFGQVIPMEAA
jgi:hypothetical protein